MLIAVKILSCMILIMFRHFVLVVECKEVMLLVLVDRSKLSKMRCGHHVENLVVELVSVSKIFQLKINQISKNIGGVERDLAKDVSVMFEGNCTLYY